MNIDANTIIGDIVKVNFKTARVFEKNKIDFCCGGGISLKDACEVTGIDMTVLIPELEAMVEMNDPDSRYIDGLELNELCDYIEKRHHTFVRENIPFLVEKLQKLCDVHGENHQELFEIKELFDGAAENLSAHMHKEEVILFPYIRKMVHHKKENIPAGPEFGQILQPIQMMEQEHEIEGERFKTISRITNNYTCPPDGCTTYQVTFQTLKDFETDLHRHIHIENNILFKKSLKLEKELVN
jgi:regulator of cell morphogenesis and NO signaling